MACRGRQRADASGPQGPVGAARPHWAPSPPDRSAQPAAQPPPPRLLPPAPLSLSICHLASILSSAPLPPPPPYPFLPIPLFLSLPALSPLHVSVAGCVWEVKGLNSSTGWCIMKWEAPSKLIGNSKSIKPVRGSVWLRVSHAGETGPSPHPEKQDQGRVSAPRPREQAGCSGSGGLGLLSGAW